MNPVFWILVIISLFVGWVLLAPVFRNIGESVLNAFNEIKKSINDEEDNEE